MSIEAITVTAVAEPLWHRVPGGTGIACRELLRGLASRPDVELDAVRARRRDTGGIVVPWPVRQAALPRVVLYEAWSRTGRPDIAGPNSDLVHSPMLPAPTSSKVPVVVTLHDLAFMQRPADFPARARRLYDRMFERVCSDATMVICSTETTRGVAIEHGLDRDRSEVVHLGVRALDPTGLDVRDSFSIDGSFVLSVGTDEPRKNVPRLIEAFEASELWTSGMQLVIVGPAGWGPTFDAAIEAISPEASDHVVTLGEVSDVELAGLYSSCHVFAYPSLAEGFGLPVLEALAAGAVVVTSSGTATAEVADDAAVLVDPNNVADIARGLMTAVHDTAERERLTAAAPAVVERHSWARHVDTTVDVYRRVIDR